MHATAKIILERIKREAGAHAQILGVELGGSFAKGTWLSGADIDVFIRFDKNASDSTFTKTSKQVSFAALKEYGAYERYADHPYVEAVVEDITVNAVPCFDVEWGCWRSAADRSPYHTKYMKEHLTDEMKNQVRLLKRFLQAHHIYGSQIEREGISGYAAEVLTRYCGGFKGVMENIQGLSRGTVLGRTTREFDTPIIILDPLDANRNLAAAISQRNMGVFMMACKLFMTRPSGRMFGDLQYTPNADWEDVISVDFSYSKRNIEVIWGQAKSVTVSMTRQLERGGFTVIRNHTTIHQGRVYCLFLLESLHIPAKLVHEGPSVFRANDAVRFAMKNNKRMVWITNDMNLACLDERHYTNAEGLLGNLLSNPMESGIPKGLRQDIGRGFRIIHGENLANAIKEKVASMVSSDHFCTG